MHLMVSVIVQHLIKVFKLEINQALEMEEVEEISVIDLLLHLILVNKLDNKGNYNLKYFCSLLKFYIFISLLRQNYQRNDQQHYQRNDQQYPRNDFQHQDNNQHFVHIIYLKDIFFCKSNNSGFLIRPIVKVEIVMLMGVIGIINKIISSNNNKLDRDKIQPQILLEVVHFIIIDLPVFQLQAKHKDPEQIH